MNGREKGSYVQRLALKIDVDDQSRFDCALLGAHTELIWRGASGIRSYFFR